MLRSAQLLTVLALLPPSAAVVAAEPAPAPRTCYPRFDLTYLPDDHPQGLIGVRPAEIARQIKGPELDVATGVFQMFLGRIFMNANVDAAEPPAFAEIEQCVLSLNLCIEAPTATEKGTFFFGGATPCVIRTVRPFDWASLVRKWFPRAVRKRLAGRTYWRTRVETASGPAESATGIVGFYIPDDRTLVCGAAEEVMTLLKRLAAGTPALAPPGWEAVDRSFAAIVVDQREERPLSGPFPPRYRWGKDFIRLLDSCETVAVGISVEGRRTSLYAVATTTDPADARKAVRSLHRLILAAKEGLAKEEGVLAEFGMALLTHAVIETDGSRFTLTTAVDRNALDLLATFLHGPD